MAGTARPGTSGRTRTTTPGCAFDPPPDDAARALHLRPRPRAGPRSAADRATSSPSSTAPTRKYWEGTIESEWRDDKTFVRGSYTYSHYYGNFDQDNSTVDNDAEHLHRLVEHRRRRRAPALELPRGRPPRRPAPRAEGVRLPPASLERERRPLRHRPVRAAVGDVELRALPGRTRHPRATPPATRSRRARAGRTPTGRSTSTTPRTSASADATTSRSERTSSTSSTTRPATDIEPRFHNSLYGTPRLYFDPRRLQVAARFLF